MAGTHAHSVAGRESPQYACALAILSGGLAFVAPQLRASISTWLACALLATLFGFIWPDKALRWGGWLCLPMFLLLSFEMLSTGNIVGVLLSEGPIFVKALSSACLGAYIGSKLSVRKLADLSAHRRVRKSRVVSHAHGAGQGHALKETAPRLKSVETLSLSHSSPSAAQQIEQPVHLHALDSALINAAQEGDLKRIRLLLADGANVDAEIGDEWTPFPMAAQDYFDTETAKTLFGQSATPATSAGQSWTALMIAAIKGHLDAVRALVEHGAQVNALNNQGWTALRFAVSMDETEILRALLDAGADANIADHEGTTALIQAAAENIFASLKMLLSAGADLHLKDHKDQTALMIAERQGHTEIIELLKEAEAFIETCNSL